MWLVTASELVSALKIWHISNMAQGHGLSSHSELLNSFEPPYLHSWIPPFSLLVPIVHFLLSLFCQYHHLFIDRVYTHYGASQAVLVVKDPPASAKGVRDTGSISGSGTWRIPRSEEPGRLQSISLQSQPRLKQHSTHGCTLSTSTLLPIIILHYVFWNAASLG